MANVYCYSYPDAYPDAHPCDSALILVPSPVGNSYCTRRDVELLFGTENIKCWADLDNEDNADDIQSRIESVCIDESAIFDDMMRFHTVKLPFPEPVPRIVKRIVALKVGVTLYGGRGYDDGNVMIRGRNKEADRLTTKILSGQIKLNVNRAVCRPGLAYED